MQIEPKRYIRRIGSRSNVNCSVYGCNSVNRKNPLLNYHLFPPAGQKIKIKNADSGVETQIDRRQLWEITLKRSKPASKHMRVCSKHFKDEDYITVNETYFTKRHLKKTAVPSENLPTFEKNYRTKQEEKVEVLITRQQLQIKLKYKLDQILNLGKRHQAQQIDKEVEVKKDDTLPSGSFYHQTVKTEISEVPAELQNSFEIEVQSHFEPTQDISDTALSKIVQIKQEMEDYDMLPHGLDFGHQNVKTEIFEKVVEDSLAELSCTHTDRSFSESNNLLMIKTECDESDIDLEGRQYAEDLKTLLPEQRNLVRTLLANIMCQAKMNILSSDYFQKLFSS